MTNLTTSIAAGRSNQLSAQILNSLLAFRQDVFVGRLGWSLPLVNGIEQDQYDTPDAVYIAIHDESQRVTGCARLLPTTAPYMLTECFPQLLGNSPAPKDAEVWELSRFAASVRETRQGRVLSLSAPTLNLLNEVLKVAALNGARRLVLVTSIGIERLMLRAGVASRRAAPPALVNGDLCVALYIDVPAMNEAQCAARSTGEVGTCA